MRKVIIIGASGSLAPFVIDAIQDAELTLFVRNKTRLRVSDLKNHKFIEGDVMNADSIKRAIAGHDIVYVNLAGDLEQMAKNIISGMRDTGVKRVIAISSIGIYSEVPKAVLIPYRKLADVVENSGLDYTILRPDWFTHSNEIDYAVTHKGAPETGTAVSRKSIADLVAKIVKNPELYNNENVGISKP